MSRSAIAVACLLARPVVGLAGWWTWSPYTLTPHFAYQDPGSGDILHSSCNSNGSASFSTKNPNKLPLKEQPKAATPLAISGWQLQARHRWRRGRFRFGRAALRERKDWIGGCRAW
ncbi:hypothetical protein LB505_013671 [Fusarium chuoi]|nr:hypothetical protein LB505_013671 [Fusarium chuoi]